MGARERATSALFGEPKTLDDFRASMEIGRDGTLYRHGGEEEFIPHSLEEMERQRRLDGMMESVKRLLASARRSGDAEIVSLLTRVKAG